MDPDTDSGDDGDAYWRRRAIALGGVLATVGLLAWACSDSGSNRSRPVRNAAEIATPSGTAVRPAGAAGSAAPGVVVPTVTVTATAKVTIVPEVPRKAGDACVPADVVVNLVETRDTFGGKDHPQFRLSVVNTGPKACTLGVGPKELPVLIRSGTDRVWSSASCAPGSGSSIQLLRRGIPYVTGIDWDRTRSMPGACSGRRDHALPGTYTAVAGEGRIRSGRQVFRLR